MDADFASKVDAAIAQDTTGKKLGDLDFHAKHCKVCGHRMIDHMVITNASGRLTSTYDGKCHCVDEAGACTCAGFTELVVNVVKGAVK